MSIEALAAGAAAPPPRMVELGPAMPQNSGVDLQMRFDVALQHAGSSMGVAPVGDVPPAIKSILNTLDRVDGEAKGVADYARSAEASNGELTPGEIVQLTMRCQEFMFHCQLSSNIANRSSDGIQQLFKQQG
jgi:hypothetical protein